MAIARQLKRLRSRRFVVLLALIILPCLWMARCSYLVFIDAPAKRSAWDRFDLTHESDYWFSNLTRFSEVVEVSGTDQFGRQAVSQESRYGYKDPSGNVIIEPQFVSADMEFYQDRAGVSTWDGWGFIDTSGTWIVPPKYYGTGSFRDGRALVFNISGDGWPVHGYVSLDGSVITPLKYDTAKDFVDGYALVSKEIWISRQISNLVAPFEAFPFPRMRVYWIIDKNGKTVPISRLVP